MIQKKISPVTYRLNTPGKREAVIHRNALKHFLQTAQVNHVVLADGELDDSDHLQLPGLPGSKETHQDKRAEEAREALTKEQRDSLDRLLEEHRDLFSTTPGLMDQTEMEIQTNK